MWWLMPVMPAFVRVRSSRVAWATRGLTARGKQTPTPQKTKKYFKTLKIFKELN